MNSFPGRWNACSLSIEIKLTLKSRNFPFVWLTEQQKLKKNLFFSSRKSDLENHFVWISCCSIVFDMKKRENKVFKFRPYFCFVSWEKHFFKSEFISNVSVSRSTKKGFSINYEVLRETSIENQTGVWNNVLWISVNKESKNLRGRRRHFRINK